MCNVAAALHEEGAGTDTTNAAFEGIRESLM